VPAAADDRSLVVTLLGPAAAALVPSISLSELLEASPLRLAQLGLRRASRRRLLAAAEIARRCQPAVVPPEPITSPRAALSQLAPLRRSPSEILAVLALDARLALLGRPVRVGEGGVSHVSAEPREVFAPAFGLRSSAIVLAHNHPSGQPEPSPEDVEFTKSIGRAGEVLGVQVLDHLVVSPRAYFSFREAGMLG
jgi:DNA repair protein RadC